MVSEPTRGDTILDLFQTSNHTLVNKVEIFSDISDYEISISNISVKQKMSWSLRHFQYSTVEEIWNALKTALDSGIQQFIPNKKLRSKCSLSLLTQEIRRLMCKRDNFIKNKNQDQTRIGVISSELSILCSKKITWQTY